MKHLESILQNDKEINIEFEEPKNPISKELEFEEMASKLKMKINPRYNKPDYDLQSIGKVENVYGNFDNYEVYKMPLQKKIDIRLKEKVDFEKTMEKIHQIIYESRKYPLGMMKNRIRVIH